jgi:ABC-type nickel/cobalt efflux system permease component RcnA
MSMLAEIAALQRSIGPTVQEHLEAYRQSGDWSYLMAALPLGVLFGMAHALMPGHSKTVLAGYVVGSGQGLQRSVATALLLALTHIASALILATVANSLITRTLVGAGRAPLLENISRLLLVGLACWMILTALRPAAHRHAAGPAFGIIAGLVPCPLTLFVMMNALARHVPAAGLAFAAAMFLGVGIVLALTAATAWSIRTIGAGAVELGTGRAEAAGRLMQGAGGLVLLVVALIELRQ